MRVLAILATIIASVGVHASTDSSTAFINDNVIRNVDLSGYAVREKRAIAIMQKQSGSDAYLLAIETPDAYKGTNFTISHVSAHTKNSEAISETLEAVTSAGKDKLDGRKVALYKYVLPKNAQKDANGRTVVVFDIVYSHSHVPYPRQAAQGDKQLVKWFGNAHMPSPYVTRKQKLKVSLASSTLVSYTKNQPSPIVKSGKTITYGPYDAEVKAYSYSAISVHGENHTPMVTVTDIRRELWLSMWGGNVAVDEFYTIRHDGPTLKNQFSRIDFSQRAQTHHQTGVVKSITLELPPMASDPYFRDDVGNVSTSNFRSELKRSVLEMRPRFPIFGGWVYNWNHGYNLPLSEYLSFSPITGRFTFEAPFLKSFKNAVIDTAAVRVVLPEGASDVEIYLPFKVDNSTSSVTYTYLDSIGRKTLDFAKNGVVDEHYVNFQISFTYPLYAKFSKPLFLSTLCFVMYLITIAYWRSDFVIGGAIKKKTA